MSAKIIDDKISYVCNICSDTISNNNGVGLKCNPTKHIFCYECIYDWYKQLNKTKNGNNYTIKNMCPICRKNGGFLPINNNFKIIKGIHEIKDETILTTCPDINPNKLLTQCGVKFKTKDGFCQSHGKTIYGGLCGIHFKMVNKNNTSNATPDSTIVV